jgi:superfamily II DNA or RNA helicase
MLVLRDYQELSMSGLRDGFTGHRSQILYLPCGGGKTECAISIMEATAKKGNRVAMVMDRRILCDQTSLRLDGYGIDHGVVMKDHYRWRPQELIQVCSIQTLEAQGLFPGLSLLIVDEAHGKRKSITEFIKNNTKVKVIGLSASPFTKGLGDIYSNIVSKTTMRELVDLGSLSPLRVFLAKEIDMTGAKKVAGEWSDKEATERGIKITGDIVAEWVKKTHEIFGKPVKTAVFCSGIAHGDSLVKGFLDAGYNFISVSHKDDSEYRKEVMIEFAKPDSSIHGLIATDILSKGWDQADVMIGISARPFSKSFSSHVQQIGRIMRPHHEKSHGILLCHSGNFLRFSEEWEKLYNEGVDILDKFVEKPKPEKTKEEKEAARCIKCGAIWIGKLDICSHCGAVRIRKNTVVTVAGQMVELSNAPKPEKYSSETKESWYQQMLGYCRDKGKNEGAAYHWYQMKFGVKPNWKKEYTPPSAEVASYCLSRQIAFAKSRRR